MVILPESPVSVPGRRERHKTATRRRLYDVAMLLFAEKGYDKTSIDEIAEQADVARATVFNYFKRKDEFLDAWGDERRVALSEAIAAQGSRHASVRDQLRQCMRILAAVNEEDRRVARTLVMAWVRMGGPAAEEPYTAYIFTEIVAEGIARGEIRLTANAVLAGHLLRDIYLGTLYRWIRGEPDPPFSLSGHLLASLDVLLEGLAP
jgi:TetR/AcrR family transcriptional regulator, cholesterol catabolism regulator